MYDIRQSATGFIWTKVDGTYIRLYNSNVLPSIIFAKFEDMLGVNRPTRY